MLSLLKQCSRLSISPLVTTKPPTILTPAAAPWAATQSRDFWRLTDQRYNNPDNKVGKCPQKSIDVDDPFESRQEMAKDGYGVKLYDLKDGQRKSLKPVIARFKRLDWGPWIRTRAGRAKKLWKKSAHQLTVGEKHVMCRLWHNRRFDRAVTTDIKEIRHIPDDPYRVYNDLSFQQYHSVYLRNIQRIKKYGPKNFNFPHHVAHFRKIHPSSEHRRYTFYEPPGYHRDIASGVYSPDPNKPQDIMPPDYLLEERHESVAGKHHERKYWRKLEKYEMFSGRLPLTSRLRLPQVGTRFG